ncbi:MAG: GTP-sensing pleiotropic transcriptional regulator CodY [Lachnospiraceae bacterium]|nr:GTP-sensing pleiotropic transcriptional regulator CodY [Lachnospiraceae bacterium]
MSSVRLLDDTRKINSILHKKNSGKVAFNDICDAMRSVLDSDVLVLSRKGKILGMSNCSGFEAISELSTLRTSQFIDTRLNERLVDILSTKESVNLETLGFSEEISNAYQAIITPINISGQRYGTLMIYKPRSSAAYSIEDIILTEYGATVVGLEMVRSVSEESAEEDRRAQGVQAALSTLSASETEAVVHIFNELSGLEGILVASRIADREGITRSVIVNALRKLESAGVIISKSSGMKGTYIKVTNELIYDEIDNLRKQ